MLGSVERGFAARMLTVGAVAIVQLLTAGGSFAADAEARLRGGAVELELSGSLTSVEDVVTTSAALGLRRYVTWSRLLVGLGVSTAFARVSDLDRVDVQFNGAGFYRLKKTSSYAFAGFGGGLRQEWLGSFGQTRYPLGVDVGLKALFGDRVAVTTSYQYRRILRDPVSDFSEHRLSTGISLLFNNSNTMGVSQDV